MSVRFSVFIFYYIFSCGFCFTRHSFIAKGSKTTGSSELDSALVYCKNSQFSILNFQFSCYCFGTILTIHSTRCDATSIA